MCYIELEVVPTAARYEREQYYIDFYRARSLCYNFCPTAQNWRGAKHRDETKRKISNWHRGRKVSEETRAKLSLSGRGRKKPNGFGMGASNGRAKLTNTDVVKIKAMLTAGVKISPIAKKYGVTYQTIWEISKGMSWVNI